MNFIQNLSDGVDDTVKLAVNYSFGNHFALIKSQARESTVRSDHQIPAGRKYLQIMAIEVQPMGTQKQLEETRNQPCSKTQTSTLTNHFSKSFWKTAKRRHCDARQNMRHLLDRYIKPHH